MTVKIVVADRRASKTSLNNYMKGWKVIAEFPASEIQKSSVLDESIRKIYEDKFKEDNIYKTPRMLYYASFRGMSFEQIRQVYSLAKGNLVSLAVNRWGRVSGWKIK